ncbi:hypothetical protein [Rathayibacter soli]|uniref:hypothetical protein n=1 Tax=Rathayibacter soli TaxID=3144168 RepID=UPI0027E59572|nr:hypothetical protein [Glaciibacter superstes]
MVEGRVPHAQHAAPQLPPWVRHRRSAFGWIALCLGLLIAAAIALVLALIIVALALAAWFVRGIVWLSAWAWGWFWFGVTRLRARQYPFVLHRPTRPRARSTVLNDSFLSTLPRLVGTTARVAVFLLAPIALLASLVGLVLPSLRARPYFAIFSLPALERKLTGLGRRRGFFDDGHDAAVVEYDVFLATHFPQRADFLAWWRDPRAPRRFSPQARKWSSPTHLGALELGPYPDVLGFPGLAAAAMRRTEIRGLRELFISQREIDDMGDPDLDDRAECAVIRTSSRIGADGIRRWILQLPSTQTWHPRSGQAPNDITADVVALSLRETTLTRAACQAMQLAGVQPHDLVLAAGFSLGGMVAGQFAECASAHGFTVSHVITAGSPIGRDRIDSSIRVLSIEHILDSVPRMEGRENPIWAEPKPSAPEWVTVKAGPPLPRGYRISSTHHSPSYAETAGAIEDHPIDERVSRYLNGDVPGTGALEFFGPGQELRDYAATRVGGGHPRSAVPVYLHATVESGVTRGTLRTTLRRVPGVIAVDIYQSRTGFPTTIVWNADVLVRSLRPWFRDVERPVVYRGLLSLLKRRRAVGIHLRLQAKESPGVLWEATVQRMEDGRWRESVDVSFTTAAAETEYLPVLLPDGWTSRINYYPADAFE